MTKISKSEMELMQLIWESTAPVTCGELLERLPAGRDWKNTTVLTFLSRLAEKGVVTVNRNGKANVYTAAVSREAYLGQETASFLEDMHGGSVKNFIAALYNTEGLSREEIAELKTWLANK